MYDVIIVGAGPAGMTAGIYAVRREMKTLVIGKEVGGQMIWANEIENYPGFEKVSSLELIDRIKKQMLSFGAELKETEVKRIEKNASGNFVLYTNQETFESRTVIIAMGLSPRRLAVPGEVEFNGCGVSYCANCDGPFYRGKTVTVIGGGNSALDAAEILSKIASQIYLIHRNKNFKAFEVLIKTVQSRSNIKILLDTEIEKISGEKKVDKITVINNLTHEKQELPTDGIFVEIGHIASTDLVADLVERNEKNQIIVSSSQETKTPGLFAAGDVTSSEYKQIVVAMGQATTAALSAYQYLQMKED